MATASATFSEKLPILQRWSGVLAAAPDSPCLIDAATSTSFSRREVNEAADHWAERHHSFSLAGCGVAFALPNGLRWLATFLGILKCGGVPIPLDASEPVASQRQLAQSAGAVFLGSNNNLEEIDSSQTLPSRSSEFCLVKLTSGTTGTPRPLLFTHSQMIADGEQVCSTMDIRSTDLNVALIPFGHSYGLGNLVMPLLLQGTASLCVSAPLPHALAADCERWKPSIFPAVPALLRVLNLSDVSREALSSLRVVISAGSALSPEVAQTFATKFDRMVHGFYGSSETGGICYDRSGEATISGRSVGEPLKGVRLEFEADQRFWVESAAVFTHDNRNASTTSHLGRHQPSDTGELNSFGELTLLGRTGRMVKIAGRRLDLSELENTLRGLPGIHDAFALPHPSTPDELAAALATSLSLEEARALLRARLAPWKVPRRLWVMTEFPLTARGKTDLRALRDKLVAAR